MDKASDFESEDCGFDPHRGLEFFLQTKIVSIFHVMKKGRARMSLKKQFVNEKKSAREQPELNWWPLDLQSNSLSLSYTP